MRDFFSDFRKDLQSLTPGDVGASVELLLRTLGENTASLLRLCAIPHKFDQELLTVLEPRLAPEEAAQIYGEFCSLSVVVATNGHLELHDDVRSHLFRKWLAPDLRGQFRSVSERLVGHFAGRDVEPNRTMFHRLAVDLEAGYAEFEELGRRRRSEYRLDDYEKLIGLVGEYSPWFTPDLTAGLQYHRGKLAADRGAHPEAIERFSRVTQTLPETSPYYIKALTRIGMVKSQLRQWEEAGANFERATKAAAAHPPLRMELGWIHHEWGVSLREQGEVQKAEQHLKKSIEAAGRLEDGLAQAIGYNSLGTVYRSRGQLPQAVEAYNQALEHLLKRKEVFRPAQVYNNLGNVYADMGDWEKSCRFLELSLEIKRKAGDTRGQATTLANLVRTYWNLGRQSAASNASHEASRLYLSIDEPRSAGIVLRDLARLLRNNDQKEEADRAYSKAVDFLTDSASSILVRETRQEHTDLKRGWRLPWWVWVVIGLGFLFFCLMIVVFVLLEV